MIYYHCKEISVHRKGGKNMAKKPDREKLQQLIRDMVVGVISGVIAGLILELMQIIFK